MEALLGALCSGRADELSCVASGAAPLVQLFLLGLLLSATQPRSLLRPCEHRAAAHVVWRVLLLLHSCGSAAAALLMEPQLRSGGTIHWPPPPLATAAAAAWILSYPASILRPSHTHLSGALCCLLRVGALALGLSSTAARAQLLPWLPTECALLALAAAANLALYLDTRGRRNRRYLGAGGLQPLTADGVSGALGSEEAIDELGRQSAALAARERRAKQALKAELEAMRPLENPLGEDPRRGDDTRGDDTRGDDTREGSSRRGPIGALRAFWRCHSALLAEAHALSQPSGAEASEERGGADPVSRGGAVERGRADERGGADERGDAHDSVEDAPTAIENSSEAEVSSDTPVERGASGRGRSKRTADGRATDNGRARGSTRQPSISESAAALRTHLWCLCPKRSLSVGIVSSLLLVGSSFALPYSQGVLYDKVVDAVHQPASVALVSAAQRILEGRGGVGYAGEVYGGERRANLIVAAPSHHGSIGGGGFDDGRVGIESIGSVGGAIGSLSSLIGLDDDAATAQLDRLWQRQIVPWLLAVGCLHAASWVLQVLVGISFALAAHTTLTRLRALMFRNLIQQEMGFYDLHAAGELSSRLINDSGALQYLAQFTSQNLLQACVKLLGSLFAMYLTHPLLALLATVVSPLNWLLVRRTGRVVGSYGVVQNAAMAAANAAAVEALGAVRTVHANAAEGREAAAFRAAICRFLRVILVTVQTETVLRVVQIGISRARDVGVLALGMHQVLCGSLSIGSFVAFNTYVSLYEEGFSSLADIWLNLQSTLASTARFVDLLERQPQIPPEGGHVPASCEGLLEVRGVTFSYPTARSLTILHRFSLRVAPGATVALVGQSGAGKSTVGRLITRFYDPGEGCILLDGREYRSLNLRWLRTQIGLVEQEPILFDLSIRENIRYGAPHASDVAVERAARAAFADEFIRGLPEGYESTPGERGARVSGGQKQRVAIARAICKDPAILVLDEATSALDSASEALVQAALDELMKERSTVVIAHRLSTVVRAHEIVVMEGGHAVERGTHLELSRRTESRYAKFMRHQLAVESSAQTSKM